VFFSASDPDTGETLLLEIPGRSPVRDSDSYLVGGDGMKQGEFASSRSKISVLWPQNTPVTSNPIDLSTAAASGLLQGLENNEVDSVVEVMDASPDPLELDPLMFLDQQSIHSTLSASAPTIGPRAASTAGARRHLDHGYTQPHGTSAFSQKKRQTMAEQKAENDANKTATNMFRKKGAYWKEKRFEYLQFPNSKLTVKFTLYIYCIYTIIANIGKYGV
jgi:hypothetical protein